MNCLSVILDIGPIFRSSVRVAWFTRPPSSLLRAGYAISHSLIMFVMVLSLLAVALVFDGSLENIWSLIVVQLSSLCIFVHSSQWRFRGRGAGGYRGDPPLVAEFFVCSNSNFSPTGAITTHPPLAAPLAFTPPPPLQKILYPRLLPIDAVGFPLSGNTPCMCLDAYLGICTS